MVPVLVVVAAESVLAALVRSDVGELAARPCRVKVVEVVLKVETDM